MPEILEDAPLDQDFRTPREFFEGVSSWLGPFTLDAAASKDNALCERFYDVRSNGLLRDWDEVKVWCNPPYSDPLAWCMKAIRELDEGRCESVVMLLHLDTSTRWFHDVVLERAAAIYFVKARIRFEGPLVQKDGSSPRPSALIHFTRNAFRVIDRVFCGIDTAGKLIQPQTRLELEFTQ